ncbi:MAG TPA: quinone-dependent dihydroorotate dehydrogenase [Catalimonadaceae bacterium]|nr:quinone-dependent dihydroorotate dehydrogenase [Catalimonadaceae bacterium]
MNWYQLVFKPLLFQLDAEEAHKLTMALFHLTCQIPGGQSLVQTLFRTTQSPDISVNLAGMALPNPVGLAAGFDKNGEWIDEMALLGFGFIEIGTVTPRPQIGNPKPRLFRIPEDEALLNRMGFNNAGMVPISKNLANRKNRKIVVGGNIGKNKNTPNEEAWKDYVACFRELAEHVDYFTINLSSPNTPGLRKLLEAEWLKEILEPVQNENQKLVRPKPIFLKIAPDLENGQLNDIVNSCLGSGLAGIVATNTTINRSDLKLPKAELEKMGQGGISGKPLEIVSRNLLHEIKALSGNRLSIISSGGIMDSEEAKKRLISGADAIQLYSGMVYRGPGLVKEVLSLLAGKN